MSAIAKWRETGEWKPAPQDAPIPKDVRETLLTALREKHDKSIRSMSPEPFEAWAEQYDITREWLESMPTGKNLTQVEKLCGTCAYWPYERGYGVCQYPMPDGYTVEEFARKMMFPRMGTDCPGWKVRL
jgi:predicted transcriptional regulator